MLVAAIAITPTGASADLLGQTQATLTCTDGHSVNMALESLNRFAAYPRAERCSRASPLIYVAFSWNEFADDVRGRLTCPAGIS